MWIFEDFDTLIILFPCARVPMSDFKSTTYEALVRGLFYTPQDPPKEQWSVIPQAQRGLNRGRGAIRRHNSATAANPPSVPSATAAAGPSSSSQATARRASTGTAASAAADGRLASAAEDGDELEEPMELSVEPVSPGSFSIFQQQNCVMHPHIPTFPR